MTTDFFNYLNQFTNQLSLFNTVTTNTTSSYQWTPLPQDLGVIRYVPPPPPPEETRMNAYRAQLVAERKKNDEACAKALALLLDNLTPEQKDSYLIHGFIKAKGGQTGRTYKIFPDRRVWCWQTRKWYCIVVWGSMDWIPPADMVLAKKLMIEGAEDYFLQTAIGSFGSAGQDA